MTEEGSNGVTAAAENRSGQKRVKLHGRAFYESIGSPKLILAPMVEQSEFAWRMLTRSFLAPSEQSNLLSYTPMFHSKMFSENQKYRDSHFQPLKSPIPSPPDTYHVSQLPPEEIWLDGNPAFDRPLTVQFCSNDPDDLLNAAKHVAPFCDAVDLNLGCPQGIAKRGGYGAFLQEDWDTISRMIKKLDAELDVPITAKMRVLETKEKTLEYAQMILNSGASILTVHGRRREQKGHNTGLADWSFIRYLRDNLPKETVLFANGNILQHEDIEKCLEETGADGVMSAEGNLYDPTIFAKPPPVGEEGREYWRGRDGKGGYRMDAVFRRYMDIIHKYALGQEPPARKPLFVPSDPIEPEPEKSEQEEEEEGGPPRKKQKQSKPDKKSQQPKNPNLTAMQAHLFHLLRPLVSHHHHIRDALARSRVGDIAAYEHVLSLVEAATRDALIAYETEQPPSAPAPLEQPNTDNPDLDPHESSLLTVQRCKRPWWIVQPYVRPLPKEALAKGAMSLSKKDRAKLGETTETIEKDLIKEKDAEVKAAGLVPGGEIVTENLNANVADGKAKEGPGEEGEKVDIPKAGVVCG